MKGGGFKMQVVTALNLPNYKRAKVRGSEMSLASRTVSEMGVSGAHGLKR